MLKKLRNYTKSEFVVNAGKLMTGTVISQAIPIAAAPLLSRIYEPADYGILGLYMSVTGLISMFGTLQYSSAIVVASNEEEVRSIINLCLRLLAIFAGVTLIAVLVLHNFIGTWLKSEQLKYWLLAAPFSIVLNGLSGIFGSYAIRTKQFALVSRNRVASTIGSTAVSLTVGYLTHNPVGLFAGLWTNQFINGLLLSISALSKTGESWKAILKSKFDEVKLKYINFPKFSLPSDFINNFTYQIPVFMLNTFGSPMAVGNYNMSNRILGLPITFISGAFGEVFKQKASEDYSKFGNCSKIFVETYKALNLILVLPFFILILFGPQIFSFVLGKKWEGAGEISQIMAVLFFFRFTISPLTYVYYIANKQKEDFYLHLLFLIVSSLAFYFGFKSTHSIYKSILIYSILNSAIYVTYLIRSYKFSKSNI